MASPCAEGPLTCGAANFLSAKLIDRWTDATLICDFFFFNHKCSSADYDSKVYTNLQNVAYLAFCRQSPASSSGSVLVAFPKHVSGKCPSNSSGTVMTSAKAGFQNSMKPILSRKRTHNGQTDKSRHATDIKYCWKTTLKPVSHRSSKVIVKV